MKFFYLCLVLLISSHAVCSIKHPLSEAEKREIASFNLSVKEDHHIDITKGGIQFDSFATLFLPRSNHDVVTITQLAKKYGRKIRVLGSTHSLNPQCFTYDYMISLAQMNRVLAINKDSCLVEGGIVIRQLCQELEKQGLTIGVLGAITEQTIAGAISTGTRGQVPSEGSLGSLVTALEVVNGKGEVRYLTLEDNYDELNATITSLGLLGVITKVQLKCTPLFLMAELIRLMPLDEALAHLDEFLHYDKLVMFWNVDQDEVKVVSGHRIQCGIPSSSLSDLKMLGRYPHLHSMENFPDTIQRVGKSWEVISLLEWTGEKQDRLVSRLKSEGQGIFQSDYSIPQEELIPILKEIKSFFRTNRKDLKLAKDKMVVEIRPVKRDHVWLSPSFERDAFSLCFHDFARGLDWTYEDAGQFITFENLLKKYKIRPHFGKAHFFTNQDLEAVFPKWKAFKELENEADPDHIFLTNYFEQLISPITCCKAGMKRKIE